MSTGTRSSNIADVALTIAAAVPFVTWKTDNLAFGSSLADQIELPLESGRNYNFVVDWGDGSTDTITAWNDLATLHTYAIAETYDVSITGVFDSLYFAASSDRPKILDVKSWGSYQWASMENTFEQCRNLNVSATDAPNLTRVTSLARMFYNARSLNGDLINWDTSNITDMSSMFYFAQVFNQNIGNWNTSKVTNQLSYIFFKAFAFNQPIGNWDTSNALTMAAMFWDASVFNQDISNWDVSNVTQMEYMFQDTDAFNQPLGS
ncbi:MAG: BspA family leucine-rich repeat surface protein [Bacteriovoracaceae bacterium]|nr:BspA family leucine-rich repeat surface protein [Bacteriovoracaceae bacterium]